MSSKINNKSYLRAKRSFLVEIAINEITILFGSDPTFTVDSSTAWMSDNFTDHMLSSMILKAKTLWKLICFPANRPLCDIVRPLVWSYGCWGITKLWIQAAYGAWYSSAWSWLTRGPLLPSWYRFLKGKDSALFGSLIRVIFWKINY